MTARDDNAAPLHNLDRFLAQIHNLMETQPETDPAVRSLAEEYAAAMEQAIWRG